MRLFNASNDQGFTILEAMVILIIIGILAALAAPSYLAWSQRKKVDSAITSIEGAIKESQRQALAKARTCNITFDTSTPKITTTTGICLLTGDRTLTDVSLEVSATSVDFDFLGNSSTTVTVVASHFRNSNLKRCLVVSTPLGLVRTGKYTGSGTDSNNCI